MIECQPVTQGSWAHGIKRSLTRHGASYCCQCLPAEVVEDTKAAMRTPPP